MDTSIIHTEPDKTNAIIEFLKAFDIKYEVKKQKKKSQLKTRVYDEQFVKEIKQSMEDKISVKGKKITIEELDFFPDSN
jgi:deoxyxylulose-5-phosphate synthase